MEDDWDLHAVVRSCSATSASSSSSTTTSAAVPSPVDFTTQSCFSPILGQVIPCLPDPFEDANAMEELQELYKPFVPKSQPFSYHTASVSSFSSSLSLSRGQTNLHRQQPKQSQATSVRSKKRKSQQKRVCHVPVEALSSDVWAWRKYGQKPIKGSPYPRGYYRCSSSKGCLARKQVERHRSDPTMYIVTYTAEHNHPAPTHRNSLAGSTRQKPCPSQMGGGDSNKASPPPANPATSSSTATSVELDEEFPQIGEMERESREDVAEEEEEEVDFKASDIGVSDDFFEGLEGLVCDSFSDQLPASFGFPWAANNSAAAASSI